MGSILVFSGLDPCAGAGMVADVEVIHQFGLTPLSIITNLTVQNTASVKNLNEVDVGLITEQFKHLQADVDFEVVKIGMLSSIAQIKTIANLVKDKTIVLDPIIAPSHGDVFLDATLIDVLRQKLLPLVKIITPNTAELHTLSGEENEQKAVEKLNCEWILLTATDTSEVEIEHRLYHFSKLAQCFNYHKLPGIYHGSGCTLASSVAALIAQGFEINKACAKALDYTYKTLLHAKSVGKMQYHPNRQQPI